MDKITIYFWQNGNVMAFDENNEQIPEIQKQGWQDLYLQWLSERGYSLDNIEIGGIGNWSTVYGSATSHRNQRT